MVREQKVQWFQATDIQLSYELIADKSLIFIVC
jgi:hypothetical protein